MLSSPRYSGRHPHHRKYLRRVCGSFYISALLEVLAAEEELIENGEAVEMDREQFVKAIRNQPCSVVDPCFGTYHNLQFTAQNDGWTQLYHARLEFP